LSFIVFQRQNYSIALKHYLSEKRLISIKSIGKTDKRSQTVNAKIFVKNAKNRTVL